MTSDGTAMQPDDYATAIGTLTFIGNADESQTFTVPIVDDATAEAAETIHIDLTNPSNAAVDATDAAVINITDNYCIGDVIVDPDQRLIRLLMPPFHRTHRDPGYIQAYPAGIRENGGQYTHAAAWLGLAFAGLGEGDKAWRVFDIISPIRRASSPEAAATYLREPYVLPGDVSGGAHAGKGGWSWYTGAAGWTWLDGGSRSMSSFSER